VQGLSGLIPNLGSTGNFGMIAFRMGKWPQKPLTIPSGWHDLQN
jgi:hypothetical protein